MGREHWASVEGGRRLKALDSYGLLETTSEVVYDDIVRLAQHICRTPIAAIRILDGERHWFRAYVGPGQDKLDQDATFCRYVAEQQQFLVVPDASADERFSKTKCATDANAKFYAGVPLVDPQGLCLGVICVYDTDSRTLDDGQIDALAALARQAIGQFELTKSCQSLAAAHAHAGYALSETQDMMRALQASERRYSSIVGAALDAIVTIDSDGVIQGWDGHAEEIFGWKTHEILLQPVSDYLVPQHLREDPASDWLAAAGQRIEITAVRKSGEEFPILLAVSNIQLGADSGHIAFVSDLSAQRLMEKALDASGRRLKLIVDSSPMCVMVLSEQGAIRQINPAGREIFGAGESDEIEGQSIFDLVAPWHLERYVEMHKAVLEGERAMMEFEVIGLKGRRLWVETHTVPLLSETGEIKGRLSILIDVSERHRAEEQVRDIEDRFKSFVESAGDAFFLLGSDGTFVEVNRTACDVLGYSSEELLAGRVEDIDETFDSARLVEIWSEMSPGVPATLNSEYRRSDGSTYPVEMRVQLFQWKGQHFLSVLARDVTDRVRLEEEARAKHAAERANLAKSQFLSRMSHELRTPLNSVLGFAQLLEMQVESARQKECVVQITNGGRHLLQLINEVLDISRIESGDMPVATEPVSLANSVQEAVSLILPLAKKRSVSIRCDVAGLSGVYVAADQRRLLQILINLLSNAVKYNVDGGDISVALGEAPTGLHRLEVADTGIGISGDMLPRLFTPFERLGIERDSAIEGTGLGLALSKRLAEVMGGDLGVEADRECGACFYVDLPAAEQQMQVVKGGHDDREGTGDVISYGSILYIEDNLANVSLMEEILRALPGIELLVATKGEEGWDKVRADSPDLVLLDLDLPDVSGAEVLDRIKADKKLRSTPVVVVSADATPARIDALLEAGAHAYITKPWEIRMLLDTVNEVLGGGQERNCA